MGYTHRSDHDTVNTLQALLRSVYSDPDWQEKYKNQLTEFLPYYPERYANELTFYTTPSTTSSQIVGSRFSHTHSDGDEEGMFVCYINEDGTHTISLKE